MPPKPYTLTPAQLLIQAERKAAKLAKTAAGGEENGIIGIDISKQKILRRSWVNLPSSYPQSEEGVRRRRVKIVTWNMLAQTLVRRELFPGSDCLRWSDRKSMLLAELAQHSEVDIICLQECDRLKDLLPALPGHAFVRASGPNKQHGLVVLYRRERFEVKSSRAVHLDEEFLDEEVDRHEDGGSSSVETKRRRRGGSRQTKNVGLIVGLKQVGTDCGVVIATTHLFWHPKFIYERVRQSLLLVRAMRIFQKENRIEEWPAILAGDLNTQPSEATYQLLMNPSRPLSQSLIDEIETSRLVHTSADKIGLFPSPPATTSLDVEQITSQSETPSASGSGSNTPSAPPPTTSASNGAASPEEKDDDEGELPDKDEKSIANTRSPIDGDGIYSSEQLVLLAREILPTSGVSSAFGSTTWTETRSGSETFGGRGGFDLLNNGAGENEPAYTCYTPLFKLTLDYLFLLPRPDSTGSDAGNSSARFVGVLETPQKDSLGDGLPRKGISASDHLAMGCEIAW